MNKFGIIFCGYNQEEHVEEALFPFLNDERFVVVCVSVPFQEYQSFDYEDNTTEILRKLHNQGLFKYFIDSPKYIKDHNARNLAIKVLKENDVDYFWIADADEKPTKEDINKIIEFVENDNDSFWWSLSYKNYIFDDKQYLEEPFCPPRIFKKEKMGCIFNGFYWDNCADYESVSGNLISYTSLRNKTISKDIAWIKHYTWPNNKLGEMKVIYQNKHHNNGICSFDWDEEKGLIFNESYYKNLGKSLPVILKEE
jgi:hypothetical protein